MGDTVYVWWPGDKCSYGATVKEISDSNCWLAQVAYVDDSAELWHDFSVEEWSFNAPEAVVDSLPGAAPNTAPVAAPASQPLYLRKLATTWHDGSPSAFQAAPDGAKRNRRAGDGAQEE